MKAAGKSKVLIIFAHPEAKSFCAAVKDTCAETLKKHGHEVKVSDLYEMKMILPLDKSDFTELSNPDFFKPQLEQKMANEKQRKTFSPELQAEHDKLEWCDTVLFVFPLYWFGMPGIMRNWCDRVLSMGFAYGPTEFGIKLRPRKGMVLYTTSGPKDFIGRFEPAIWQLTNECMLGFCGITALEPYVAYAVAHIDNEARLKMLEEVKDIMSKLDDRAVYKTA